MADVSWSAEGECGDCGWRGEIQFEDDTWVTSDHDCEEDE